MHPSTIACLLSWEIYSKYENVLNVNEKDWSLLRILKKNQTEFSRFYFGNFMTIFCRTKIFPCLYSPPPIPQKKGKRKNHSNGKYSCQSWKPWKIKLNTPFSYLVVSSFTIFLIACVSFRIIIVFLGKNVVREISENSLWLQHFFFLWEISTKNWRATI